MFKRKKQKSAEGNGNDQPKAVVGGGGGSRFRLRRPRLRLGNKKLLVISAVLLVGTGAAAGGIVYLQNSSKDKEQKRQEVQETVQQVAQEAMMAYDPETGEGYEDAQKVIDDAIQRADTSDEQASLNIEKASVLMRAQQHSAALQAAQRAEELNPTMVTAAYLGHAYRGLGNKQEAIRYYRLTIDRINEYFDEPSGADIQHYERLIAEVQQQ